MRNDDRTAVHRIRLYYYSHIDHSGTNSGLVAWLTNKLIELDDAIAAELESADPPVNPKL